MAGHWDNFGNDPEPTEPGHEGGLSIATQNEAVLTIVTILIFITIIFETLKEYLLENTKAELRNVVNHLYGELTVLGFIGLLVFVLDKSGSISSIVNMVDKHEHHNISWLGHEPEDEDDEKVEDYNEMTETCHMVLFLIAVLFGLAAMGLIKMGSMTRQQWRENEELFFSFRVYDSQSEGAKVGLSRIQLLEKYVEQCHITDIWHGGYLNPTSWPKLYRRTKLRKQIEYLALRDAFLSFHGGEEAIRQSYSNDQDAAKVTVDRMKSAMTADFAFDDYLTINLGETLGELVKLETSAWVCTWMIFVPCWATIWISRDVLRWITCSTGFMGLAVFLVISNKLSKIKHQLMPTIMFDTIEEMKEGGDGRHSMVRSMSRSKQRKDRNQRNANGIGTILESINDDGEDEPLLGGNEPPRTRSAVPKHFGPTTQSPICVTSRRTSLSVSSVEVGSCERDAKEHEAFATVESIPYLRLTSTEECNQHEQLFWRGEAGVEILMQMMRVTILTLSLGYAVFFIMFLRNDIIKPDSSGPSPKMRILELVLVILPLPAIGVMAQSTIRNFVQVTNVGMMRVPRVVLNVVGNTTMRKRLRILNLLGSMQQMHIQDKTHRIMKQNQERLDVKTAAAKWRTAASKKKTGSGSAAMTNVTGGDTVVNFPEMSGVGSTSESNNPKSTKLQSTSDFVRLQQRRDAVIACFDAIDVGDGEPGSGDGCLTHEELGTLLVDLGLVKKMEDAKVIINVLDKDNDGTIDRQEFVEWADSVNESKHGNTVDDVCNRIFHLVDPCNTGTFTAVQMMRVIQKLDRHVTLHDVMEMVAEIDDDGDGIITRSEFRALVKVNIHHL